MSKKKAIMFIRHAHRDNLDRSLDNGLSAKGKRQAERLRVYMTKRLGTEFSPPRLLSSPKLRCQETLNPLACQLGIALDVHIGLAEQGVRETSKQFEERIHAFLAWALGLSVGSIVVCSHGDWLPLAVFHLLGIVVSFKKGSVLELQWADGQSHLISYLPSLKMIDK